MFGRGESEYEYAIGGIKVKSTVDFLDNCMRCAKNL